MKKKIFQQWSIVLATCLAFTHFISIPSVLAETTNNGTAEEQVESVYETAEFDMQLSYIDSKSEEEVVYWATPIDSTSIPNNIHYHVVFDKSKMPYGFPKGDLKDLKIHIKADYVPPLGSENPAKLYVKEWSIYSENNNYKTHFVKVTGIHFQQGEFIQYEVEPVDGSSIERISFKRSNLNDKFPLDNLMNSTIIVAGPILTSDNKTIDVREWFFSEEAEQIEEEQETPDLIEVHGQLKPLLFEDNTGEKSLYYFEFVDFDGKEYLTVWDTSIIQDSFYPYNMEGKYTLGVVIKGKDEKKPLLEVHTFTKKEDDFEFKTNETVSILGTIGQRVNENSHRHTYEFTVKDKKYYAVFDTEVLGNTFLNKDFTDEVLELTGIVYKENNIVYLGVMGYRNPYANENYGNGNEIGNSKFEKITATPVYLVSYTDTDVAYRVVTSEGLEHTFLFNKSLLKDKHPSSNIIGKTFEFIVMFDKKGPSKNSYVVVGYTSTNQQGFEQDRGKFLKIVERSSSAVIYEFESIDGGKYKVLVNRASTDLVGGAEKLVGQVATVYGQERIYGDKRLFDAYMISPVNVPHVNKQKNDTVTFRGKVEKITARDNKGITLFARNQYGQSEYLYIETDFLKDKFPASLPLEQILSNEITVTGYRMSNGVLLVKDIGFPKVPTEYPEELKPLYEEPDYFPNMKGFTGILDVSDIGGTHLMLITSTDKYLLHGKPEVMKQIENNLRNIVYLRGEYREAGSPYWTGEIKVYDIQVLDKNTNTIIKPISEPVHDLIPDPQKEAHHTIQINELPKEYPYGKAIPEALFFPEIPKAKDIPYTK